MKTKSVVLTMAAVMATVFAFAAEPAFKVAVIKQNDAETFKVIYEGATAGSVTLKVYDSKGSELLSETTNGLSKFMRPINFTGMEEGEYTVEITDATGTQSQKINYQFVDTFRAAKTDVPVSALHITKLLDGKYLMSVASQGNSRINVNIYDGNGNLVHDENRVINGNLGLVYNLRDIKGQPSFHVVDSASNKALVK